LLCVDVFVGVWCVADDSDSDDDDFISRDAIKRNVQSLLDSKTKKKKATKKRGH
jgi:hypothetical protein